LFSCNKLIIFAHETPINNRREIRNSTAEFLFFQAEAKEQGVEVYYKGENIWVMQTVMATLFNVTDPSAQVIEQGTKML